MPKNEYLYSERMVTPIGYALYPCLAQPKNWGDGKPSKYELRIAFEASQEDQLAPIFSVVRKLRKDFHGNNENVSLAIKSSKDEDGTVLGYVLTLRSWEKPNDPKRKPQCINVRGEKIDGAEIVSGARVRASVVFYAGMNVTRFVNGLLQNVKLIGMGTPPPWVADVMGSSSNYVSAEKDFDGVDDSAEVSTLDDDEIPF